VFVRLKRTKKSKHPTVQVVESVRDGKKIRQNVLVSLGVLKDEADRERMLQVGHALISKLTAERESQDPQGSFDFKSLTHQEYDSSGKPKIRTVHGELPVYPSDLTHVRTEKCGFTEVFGLLSKQLGFEEILKEADQSGEHIFNATEIIQSLVTKRIEEPASKRRSLFSEFEERGHLPFELHHVYRAMDLLLPYADRIQGAAQVAAVSLLQRKVECYFYDATTLFFESIVEDELKTFGYSKDGKFNQVQVLLCLLVTDEGIPVGYEIFSGKTQEKTTLATALESLAGRYQVVGSTVVGDRGILSQDNLRAAASHKMHFILGERLRGLPKKCHDVILDRSQYKPINGSDSSFLIRDIPHPTRGEKVRLILGYSDERAKKDKSDRERLIKKLEKRLKNKKKVEPKEFISNRGIKKYIDAKGGEVTFNREAIARDERWDGYFGIATDHPLLEPREVLGQYRGLWQVEAQFRNYKHSLEARPMYHWTPDRIRSHILICFMSLCLERHLELILKKAGLHITTQNIHDALRRCERVIFQDKKSNRLFQMGSNKSVEAKQIYTAIGLDPRARTYELPNPKAPVVPTSHSVKPQLVGIR
jgi:transposase